MIAWIHGTRGFGTLLKILSVMAGVVFVSTLFLPDTKKL